jgi:hypothetical protein
MDVADSTGLCARCGFAKWIQSARGSTFILCERSLTDPDFPKYPMLPVLRCEGYVLRPPPAAHRSD